MRKSQRTEEKEEGGRERRISKKTMASDLRGGKREGRRGKRQVQGEETEG